VAWFKGRGRWRVAHGTYRPRPGDLVFWSYGANGPGLASHVGIVVSPGTSSGFWTIQGDTTDTESGDGNCCRRKWVANDNRYLLGFGLPAYGLPAPATPTRSYTVEPGDTLSGIAAANYTTWPALAKLNNLPDPNRIDVGQVLKLPASKKPAGPIAPRTPAGRLAELKHSTGLGDAAIGHLETAYQNIGKATTPAGKKAATDRYNELLRKVGVSDLAFQHVRTAVHNVTLANNR
jgi:LysM repeat protein